MLGSPAAACYISRKGDIVIYVCVLFNSTIFHGQQLWRGRNKARSWFFFVVVRNDVQSCRYRAGIPNVETFPHICTKRLCPAYLCFPETFSFLKRSFLKRIKKKPTRKTEGGLHILLQPQEGLRGVEMQCFAVGEYIGMWINERTKTRHKQHVIFPVGRLPL